jgi:hypothetical protein
MHPRVSDLGRSLRRAFRFSAPPWLPQLDRIVAQLDAVNLYPVQKAVDLVGA